MDKNASFRIDFRHPQTWSHPTERSLDDAFFKKLDQEELTGGNALATLTLRQLSEDDYRLHIHVRGSVTTLCDRCLEEVQLPIEAEDDVVLTFNAETDNDDAFILSERDPVFDAAWTLYEIIATSLPLERKHADGECAAEMLARIQTNEDYN